MSANRRLALAVLTVVAVGACQEEVVNVVEVSSVQVSGGGSPLLPGGTVQLSATAKDDRNNTLSNRAVSWSSSNSAVATVSGGLVTAVAAGAATISAQIEGVSGSVALTVNNPVPTLSALAPNQVLVGSSSTQVTLTGTNFVSTTVVLWNGTERQTQYLGPTSVRVTLTTADLATTGNYNITVRNPTPGGGVSSAVALTVANPVPTVTSLAPATATMGAAFELTVTGAGFVPTSVVLWNGQDRPTTYVNGTTLRASITAADVAATGSFNVTVRNPAPGGGSSGPSALAVVYPVPVVNSLSPADTLVGSAAFQLTVTGTGFVNGSVVAWNGADRGTQFVSATLLRASISATDLNAAGSFNVSVRNPTPGGGTSGTRAFLVKNPMPVIGTLSPGSVTWSPDPVVGAQLTVTGTGFVAGSVVRWNGQDRPTTFLGNTSVRALLSAADLATPALVDITVMNPAPGGGASATRQFMVAIPATGPRISAFRYTTCAVRGNGEAYCWGDNRSGEVGDGTTNGRSTPTRVESTVPFVAVASGANRSCALAPWGAAYCWGEGRATPAAVAGAHAFLNLAVGSYHACGVTAAGELYCWGSNSYGQLGDGSTSSRSNPTRVGSSTAWSAVFAGSYHTCALSSARRMYCWGRNYYGQLGDASTTDRLVPTAVSGSLLFNTATLGYNHTCAIATSGGAWCWGASSYLGTGGSGNSSVPVAVSGGQTLVSLAGGSNHTCGLSQAGGTWCWGSNYGGQLGTGSMLFGATPQPVSVPALRDIDGGELHTCGITSTGSVYCWGERTFGALGDGVLAVRPSPVGVSGAASGYGAADAGGEFSCGLAGTTVRCWGHNSAGQLGDGSSIDRTSPVVVAGGIAFTRVATGAYHACGLTSTGAAYCWGEGYVGQLGNGGGSSTVPVPVTTTERFSAISAGQNQTCAVTTAGELRCWGGNYDGQLGDGTVTPRYVPTAVTGVSGLAFTRVSSSQRHSCAVTTGGQLYCWGDNGDGQLGDGTTTDRLSPVRINVAGATVTGVATGYYHTCAITNAGTYCWGFNGIGELGNGSSSSQPVLTPVLVQGNLAFRSLSLGLQSSCGVTTSNVGYCWGANSWGQLGLGNFDWPNQPTPITGAAGWTDVRLGSMHSCGVTTAGAVQCWGRLRHGELGIGISGLVLSPAPVSGGVVFGEAEPCSGDGCAVSAFTLSARRLPLRGAIASSVPWYLRLEPVRPPECDDPGGACPAAPVRFVR